MNREFSAGGAVYRKNNGSIMWMVRRNKPSELYPEKNIWTLPRGRIEEGETTKEAAVREVEEEGGVRSEVIDNAYDVRMVYTPRGGERTFKVVSYFLMKYIDEVPGGFSFETAEVSWLPLEEARKKLTYSSEKKAFDKATEVLEGRENE